MKPTNYRASAPAGASKALAAESVFTQVQRMQKSLEHPPSAAPSTNGGFSRSGPTTAAAVATKTTAAPVPTQRKAGAVKQAAAKEKDVEEAEWSDDAVSPESPKAVVKKGAPDMPAEQIKVAPKMRGWRTTKRGSETAADEELPSGCKPVKAPAGGPKLKKKGKSEPVGTTAGKRSSAPTAAAAAPLEEPFDDTEEPPNEDTKPQKVQAVKGKGAKGAKTKGAIAAAAKTKKAAGGKKAPAAAPRRSGRSAPAAPVKDAEMEEIEPHADVDDAEEPKEVSKMGKFNSGAVAEAPAAKIAAANEKKNSPPPSAAAAAAVLAEKDLNTCGDIDELPDWMAVPAPQVRRSSPIVKSYFDDVMPGNLNRQSSPMYVHDTSSDEEDDFDMQAAYTAAAADVAATNAPAEPAAVKGNKKVGRGKTARTTGNQATLAAVKKPKAVPTKKQATAKAKTPKTKAATTAAKGKKQQPARNLSATRKAELSPVEKKSMDWKEQDEFEDPYAGDDQGGDMHMFDGNWDDAPIDDVAWIPAAQRPLESSSPDEDPFDLDEDPIEDPSDPKERKNTRVTVPVVKSAQNKNTWQGNAASGDIKKMGKGEATAAAGGAGAKHAAVAGLKAALAKGSNTEKNNTLTNGDDEIDMSPPEAATGVKPRRTLDAAAVLKKRTSPPSTVKGKGKSRLAALKGAAGGVGIDGKTVAGGAAAAYTPARLQTITPAVEGGKKRGI